MSALPGRNVDNSRTAARVDNLELDQIVRTKP
jgi:hypothetical protein